MTYKMSQLDSERGVGWQKEPSMIEARSLFGLSVAADGLIANGGLGGTNHTWKK